MPHSVQDLEDAKSNLALLVARRQNYDGGNPHKYKSEIGHLRYLVITLEGELRASGQLPMTPGEKLQVDLDRLYPDAESRLEVEYQGQRYVRQYRPVAVSRSGKTVHSWEGYWKQMDKMSKEQQIQFELNKLYPNVPAATVVEVGGTLYCRRLYRWAGGRTSLWWKAVSDLAEKEQIKCLLDHKFPTSELGDEVTMDAKRYRRSRSAGGGLCWRACKSR